jgi:DNA-binding winged helix-turn-helix (wHTH) protein/TolB-like protein/tetratricopeptide (TPR) repeat protein
MASCNGYLYRFGPFHVDPVKRQLLKEGEVIPVPSKAFDMLIVLLENSGQVVERSDLMQKLWPDTFVEEINLNVHISSLRKALGENPSDHRYIVTVPRRGYSFVAQLSTIENGNAHLAETPGDSFEVAGSSLITEEDISTEFASDQIRKPFWSRRTIIYSSFLLALIVLAIIYVWVSLILKDSVASPAPTTIAVLPFKQLSSDEEYIGVGIADALITKLSNIKSLTVRPTSAVLRYNTEESDSLRAGRELRVDMVMEGKIQREGQRIRVTVQMLRVHDGESMWAEPFDESFTNIFSVQDSISRRVAEVVSAKLNAEEKQLLAKRYTENTEAYRAYIKGRYFWNKRSEEGLKKATEYFNEAIELDPAYALAYSGLADSYVLSSIFGSVSFKDSLPKAKAAAIKALEIDDSLAEAHTSLAYVKTRYEWDWAGAETEFNRALDLNPNYATAHHWYGEYLMLTGRTDEAVAEMERALEIDPLSVIISSDLGWILYYNRSYDRAIQQCKKTLEIDPDFIVARLALALSYGQKGMYEESLAEFKYKEMESWYWSRRAHILAVSGKKNQAQHILEKYLKTIRHDPQICYTVAGVYAGLKDKEQTMLWLEKAYQVRHELLIYLKADPRFDPLRTDPRFHGLLRRIGLEA